MSISTGQDFLTYRMIDGAISSQIVGFFTKDMLFCAEGMTEWVNTEVNVRY